MRKPLLFISLGTLVVLSVTMASYFVLTKFYPSDEIRRMTISMSRLQSLTESIGFHWTVTDGNEDVYTTLYTTGPVKLGDPTKLEHDTIFRAVFLSKSNQYKDLLGEFRNQEGKTYLTYAPPGPNIQGVDFSHEGTWVSFESGEFSSWGSLIPNLKIPFSLLSSQKPWTPDALKRLRILLALTDVFQVKFDGIEETVGGIRARVIDARFDSDAVKSFLYDVIRAREQREPTDEERLNIDSIATNLDHLSVRLWIGKKDHLLYRLQAVGGIPKESSNTLTPLEVRMDFSKFNQEFEIQKPAVTIPFSTMYQSLLQTLPSDKAGFGYVVIAPTFTQDATVPDQTVVSAMDPDGDGLNNILEIFFGTDPNNYDTDGDGVSDGDEVKHGTNPRGKGPLFGFGMGK